MTLGLSCLALEIVLLLSEGTMRKASEGRRGQWGVWASPTTTEGRGPSHEGHIATSLCKWDWLVLTFVRVMTNNRAEWADNGTPARLSGCRRLHIPRKCIRLYYTTPIGKQRPHMATIQPCHIIEARNRGKHPNRGTHKQLTTVALRSTVGDNTSRP